MIYGYIRVSTDKQTVENQRFEIEQFAKMNNLTINKWIEETISGTVEVEKRKLGKLLEQSAKDDVIVASELSRLGRNLLQIMSVLHYCIRHEIKIWTIKDHYRLGHDIQSKVLAFAFGLSAEIERNLISERTKEALARLKADGKVLGRKTGSRNRHHKLDHYKEKIIALLDQHMSQNQIAVLMNVNRNTMNKYVKELIKNGLNLRNV